MQLDPTKYTENITQALKQSSPQLNCIQKTSMTSQLDQYQLWDLFSQLYQPLCALIRFPAHLAMKK